MAAVRVLRDEDVEKLLRQLRGYDSQYNKTLGHAISAVWDDLHAAWWKATRAVNKDPTSPSTASYNWPRWNIEVHTTPSLLFFLTNLYAPIWADLDQKRPKVKDEPTIRIKTIAARLGLTDEAKPPYKPPYMLFLHLGPELIKSSTAMKEFSAYLGKWGQELTEKRNAILEWLWEATLEGHGTNDDKPPMPTLDTLRVMVRNHPPALGASETRSSLAPSQALKRSAPSSSKVAGQSSKRTRHYSVPDDTPSDSEISSTFVLDPPMFPPAEEPEIEAARRERRSGSPRDPLREMDVTPASERYRMSGGDGTGLGDESLRSRLGFLGGGIDDLGGLDFEMPGEGQGEEEEQKQKSIERAEAEEEEEELKGKQEEGGGARDHVALARVSRAAHRVEQGEGRTQWVEAMQRVRDLAPLYQDSRAWREATFGL